MANEIISFFGGKKLGDFFHDINKNKNPGTLWAFFEYKCPKLPQFMELISDESILPIVDFAYNFHQNDKRKVTKDPYFKHVLYTAYLSWEKAEKLGNKFSKNEKLVLIGSALLHDAIELRNKTTQYNEHFLYAKIVKHLKPKNDSEFEQLRKIITVSSLMVPDLKPENPSKKAWVNYKIDGFNKIMKISPQELTKKYEEIFKKHSINYEDAQLLTEIIRHVKIADEMANIEETIDDAFYGRDGKEIEGMKPLSRRWEVFKERRKIISNEYLTYPLIDLFLQQTKDLDYLKLEIKRPHRPLVFDD